MDDDSSWGVLELLGDRGAVIPTGCGSFGVALRGVGMYDVPARPAWQREALCRGIDVELFFPTRGKNSVARESIRRACGACPVRGQCIELANALPEHFGMFGGTSERQRLVLRRRGVLRMADGAVVTMDATTRAVSVTKPRGEVMTRYGARLLLESLDTRRRPLAATG